MAWGTTSGTLPNGDPYELGRDSTDPEDGTFKGVLVLHGAVFSGGHDFYTGGGALDQAFYEDMSVDGYTFLGTDHNDASLTGTPAYTFGNQVSTQLVDYAADWLMDPAGGACSPDGVGLIGTSMGLVTAVNYAKRQGRGKVNWIIGHIGGVDFDVLCNLDPFGRVWRAAIARATGLPYTPTEEGADWPFGMSQYNPSAMVGQFDPEIWDIPMLLVASSDDGVVGGLSPQTAFAAKLKAGTVDNQGALGHNWSMVYATDVDAWVNARAWPRRRETLEDLKLRKLLAWAVNYPSFGTTLADLEYRFWRDATGLNQSTKLYGQAQKNLFDLLLAIGGQPAGTSLRDSERRYWEWVTLTPKP